MQTSPLLRLPRPTPIGEKESLYLDVARALSAQLVLWGHLGGFLGGDKALIGGQVKIQNLGVVVFFLLSGYLITRTIQRHTEFKTFFIDRFSRIYVTYVPCLLLIVGADLWMRQLGVYDYADGFNLPTFIGNLFMLQDHAVVMAVQRVTGLDIGVTSFGSARPLWTLAVEWWLYLLFGWLALVRRRNLLVLAALAALPLAHATFARGEGLTLYWMMGGAMVFLPEVQARARTLLLIAMGFVVLAGLRYGAAATFYDFQIVMFLALAMATMMLLTRQGYLNFRVPRALIVVIRTLAGASYALYLLHYSTIELFRSMHLSAPQWALASLVGANLAAIGVYLVFDRNHKRIRDAGLRLLPQAWLSPRGAG